MNFSGHQAAGAQDRRAYFIQEFAAGGGIAPVPIAPATGTPGGPGSVGSVGKPLRCRFLLLFQWPGPLIADPSVTSD